MTQTLTIEELYEKLSRVKLGGSVCLYTRERIEAFLPTIQRIQDLKREKNAVILAHTYVNPEIIFGVSDFVGDSYQLSRDAKKTEADTIVFAAVKFMAETAKILNPEKAVLVPSKNNGCTLADAVTEADVRALREQYPDCTYVCYINTSAAVKAECDVCVTSSNVYDIVEAIPNRKIYFLPDKYMGQNLISEMKRRGVAKTIRFWDGSCYVHEAYDPEMIDYVRLTYPGVRVVSHPECSPAVLEGSDYVGSTSQIIDYVKETAASSFLLLTECGLSSRLQAEVPGKKVVGSCTMCRYMKSNTLEDILRVLESPDPEDVINLDPAVQKKAWGSVEAMFRYAALTRA